MANNVENSESEQAAAVWVPIEEITAWQDNPRRNDGAVPQVVESIRRFGFGAPILARKANGEIIAGHTRLRAAQELGLPKVPVRYLDLDPVDAHLLAIADNKLGEIAEWDEQMLEAILSTMKAQEVDLIVGTGFTQLELEKMLAQPDFDPASINDQGKLDELAKTTCPKCGHEF